jgi:hypothetical protein
MKNITLAVESAVLEEVRVYASNRKTTTVNGLVRDFLEGIAEQENKTARAQHRLAELIGESTLEVGDRTGSRDDLHER